MTPPKGPEEVARERIDVDLIAAGWQVQDSDDINLTAGRGVAIREFKMEKGYGFAHYLLFVTAEPIHSRVEQFRSAKIRGSSSVQSAGLGAPRRRW